MDLVAFGIHSRSNHYGYRFNYIQIIRAMATKTKINEMNNIHQITHAMLKYLYGIELSINGKLMLTTSFAAFFMQLIQQYIFKDWEYLNFLIVLFVLDTVFGVWKSIKDKTFDFDKIWDVIAKAFVYGGVLVVGHVLSYFTVDKNVSGYGFVANVFYSMLILFEARSALRNMGEVYPNAAFIQWAEGKISEIIQKRKDAAE